MYNAFPTARASMGTTGAAEEARSRAYPVEFRRKDTMESTSISLKDETLKELGLVTQVGHQVDHRVTERKYLRK